MRRKAIKEHYLILSSMIALAVKPKMKQKRNQHFISNLTVEINPCPKEIKARFQRIMQKIWLPRKSKLQNSRQRMMEASNWKERSLQMNNKIRSQEAMLSAIMRAMFGSTSHSN